MMSDDEISRNALENFAALVARSVSMLNANFSEERSRISGRLISAVRKLIL
jgi:hypothetical protein